MSIRTKDVTLSDGRVVSIRTLTGADEMLAIKIVAKELKAEEQMASILTQTNVMIALSIFSCDGVPIRVPNTFEDVLILLAGFGMRDWNKIREYFQDLNDEDETGEGFLQK